MASAAPTQRVPALVSELSLLAVKLQARVRANSPCFGTANKISLERYTLFSWYKSTRRGLRRNRHTDTPRSVIVQSHLNSIIYHYRSALLRSVRRFQWGTRMLPSAPAFNAHLVEPQEVLLLRISSNKQRRTTFHTILYPSLDTYTPDLFAICSV